MPAAPDTLFISGKAPWTSSAPAACLDALMTTAIFDTPTALLLHGDGVWQVLHGQDGTALQQKTLARGFGALPLYGIDTVYLEAAALEQRGLALSDLLTPEDSEDPAQPLQLVPLQPRELVSLLAGARVVMNF